MPSTSSRLPTRGATRRAVNRSLAWLPMALVAALVAVTPYGCAHVNPHFDPGKAHHTPTGFKNLYGVDEPKSLWQVIHWRLTGDRPAAPPGGWPIEVVKAQTERLRANRSEALFTWLGHATLFVQTDGLNILIDPHFTERASPFRWLGPQRIQPPPIAMHELPRIDVVLISHNHYDHLDHGTVTTLAKQAGGPPLFLVPLGLGAWFKREGITNVVEMDWWDRRTIGALAIHFVPAHHWSARTRADRNESLWGGFVIESAKHRVIYTGDTGYAADFRDIQRRFGAFDLAAIPIGAYEPRWFMKPQHVNPEEAVQIYRDLNARHALGVHWGTFMLTDEPMDEPPKLLAQARAAANLPESAFFVMKVGETRSLERPGEAGG